MADETPQDAAQDETPDETPDGGARAAAPTRRPTAAASAASRARRIGGARTGANPPSASTPDGAAAQADEAAEADTVSIEKPARTRRGAATAPVGEPAGPAEATASSAKDRNVVEVPAWLRWVPAAVLSVCAIVMIVVILVAGHGVWYAQPSASSVRDRVLAAAKTCTAATNTYSYQTLAQDEKNGLTCATGDWAKQYRKAIDTIVKPSATKLKASQAVQINNAGIENISGNGRQWTVVLFGQTKITQSGQKKARLDPFSAQVVMRHVGDQWLISKINTIVNPSG